MPTVPTAPAAPPQHAREHVPVLVQDERQTQWSAKTWIWGLSGVLITFAGAVFCLLAGFLIPSARSADPTNFHGIMVIPWGSAILGGAPALFTASVGMLAALIFLASRHYTDQSRWFRGGLALIGLVSLGFGTLGLFGATLMPELFYNPVRSQENANQIPWPYFFQLSNGPLLILGLIIIAILIMGWPAASRKPGAFSGKAGVLTGIAFIGLGVWTWFAPQLFPLELGSETRSIDGFDYNTTPWPQILTGVGDHLSMVGFGALFWGLLLLLTHRTPLASPPVAKEAEGTTQENPEVTRRRYPQAQQLRWSVPNILARSARKTFSHRRLRCTVSATNASERAAMCCAIEACRRVFS
ncbi:hypothetical protein [Arthrobacter antibioticus]|uniref:hypothetical protein n=1 Tax=Arthrobacter sp. H35-MC1 TaxID=3046203 RepID=UPI0024B9E785|nr:hypothetical protein [Arthrobacter sp. H35-MC1]MDJ0316937.1 hypothetical protein [Arthrobacter sp. H35-MC1]